MDLGDNGSDSMGGGDERVVGLRSMREEESDRFFGRSTGIAQLVERFRRRCIVASSHRAGPENRRWREPGSFLPSAAAR